MNLKNKCFFLPVIKLQRIRLQRRLFGIKLYPQKMSLQKRLFGNYSDFFLPILVPCTFLAISIVDNIKAIFKAKLLVVRIWKIGFFYAKLLIKVVAKVVFSLNSKVLNAFLSNKHISDEKQNCLRIFFILF